MKPIALAFKNYEVNPFTGRGSGELMIVHQCLSCRHISPNRIAGDDSEYHIISLIEDSLNVDDSLMVRLKSMKISIITNSEDVLVPLFGINYKYYM